MATVKTELINSNKIKITFVGRKSGHIRTINGWLDWMLEMNDFRDLIVPLRKEDVDFIITKLLNDSNKLPFRHTNLGQEYNISEGKKIVRRSGPGRTRLQYQSVALFVENRQNIWPPPPIEIDKKGVTMHFTTNKSKLISAIQAVQGAIGTRVALPILSNILLELKSNILKLTATNLDISISSTFEVQSQKDGAVTVPAQKFYEIISSIADENIDIEVSDKNRVMISTPKCKFRIMGISYEEFPRVPVFDQTEALKLDSSILAEMLQLTAFAASVDEAKYVQNAILHKISKDKLTLVATSGQKLAMIEKTINSNQEKTIIIPIKTIAEIQKNLSNSKEVSLIFAENQALFDFGATQIISRLVEGNFPNYVEVIPLVAEQKVKIKRVDFLEAVKKAALLVTPNFQSTKFEFLKDKLIISKVTPDVGDFVEEVEIEYSGEPVTIGFKPEYLIDVLKVLKDEFIEFEVTAADRPGIIRTGSYIFMTLPMNVE